MMLTTTLSLAAAAAIINIWLTTRIGWLRMSGKILHGDGGDPLLSRRMRAQLNFAENVPLVLILIAAIEMTGKGGKWLAVAGAVFMLARLAHGLGMDLDRPNPLRAGGTMVTLLTQVGLSIMAVLITLGRL